MFSIAQKLFKTKCTHKSAKNGNCNYCPDCGKKVEAKWINIKCSKCGHIRAAKKAPSEKILPEKDYCCNCGSKMWSLYYYYEYNIPEKLKEISVKKIEEVEDNPFKSAPDITQTRVWVDKPFYNQEAFHRNIIKASNRHKN